MEIVFNLHYDFNAGCAEFLRFHDTNIACSTDTHSALISCVFVLCFQVHQRETENCSADD